MDWDWKHPNNWIALAILALIAVAVIPNFLRARKRGRATTILNDARLLDAAVDKFAIEQKKSAADPVTWVDISPYLKPNSRLAQQHGTDLYGNPFVIGPTVQDGVHFSQESVDKFDDQVPLSFWQTYAPVSPSPAPEN